MKTRHIYFARGKNLVSYARRLGIGMTATLCLGLSWTTAQDQPLQVPRLDLPALPGAPGLPSDLSTFEQDDPAAMPGLLPEMQAPMDEESARPVKKVDDSLAGWNGAESGRPFNLGDTLRRNWVMVDDEGKLHGQVIGQNLDFTDTEVYFLERGRQIEKVSVNARGQFVVFGLDSGVYTIMVASSGQYAVNCLLVLEHDAMGGPSSSFRIPVGESSPRAVFEQVVIGAPKVGFRNFGQFAFAETKEDPARLYGLRGISTHRPAAVDATTLGNNRVSLTSDGQVIGRLRAVDHATGRPVNLSVTEVSLIANDAVVASTQTNRFGTFQLSGVSPGSYTLMAAGKDGIAVTGFEVVSADPAHGRSVQNVAWSPRRGANALDVTLSPRRDIGWINSYFRDNVPPPRDPPVEDVPYDPYADYGHGDWFPYGFGMGDSMLLGDCGACEACGWGWTTARAGCFGKFGHRGWKSRCGCRHKHHHSECCDH